IVSGPDRSRRDDHSSPDRSCRDKSRVGSWRNVQRRTGSEQAPADDSCRARPKLGEYPRKMIDPPYRTVAVASTFSPRFLQVIAEGKRIRDRLCRQMHLIYVGKCDEETTRKFGEAFLQLKLPSESTIHYQEGDPAVAILAVAATNEIDLLVAGALEKEAVLRPFLGNVARRLVREASCSVMLFTKPEQEPKPLGRIVFMAEYSEHGRSALEKALHLALLEKCEKLFVIRVYTS